MRAEEEWMLFRKFDDPRTAAGLCLWLRNEQVNARYEGCRVYVDRTQCHRAEWIVEHLPPTEDELLALAPIGA